MPTGRHAHVTSRHLSTSSKHGHVSYLGFFLLLVGGGVIIGSAFVLAYLAARLYFGLPLTL